jgi:hypothetical protein
MFTVEFEPECSVITSLDNNDAFDDVEVLLCEDNSVFIVQHMLDVDDTNIIYMSYQQLTEISAALNMTEGAYTLETKGD